MKKNILFLTAAIGLLLTVGTARVLAADTDKEVTLTGKAVCGKCALHLTDKCQNVIQVEKDGKTVNYYLTQNEVSKAFHKDICQNDGEKVTATGIVSEVDGKETLVASKIEAVK